MHWSWHGAVALVLATCVGVTWSVVVIVLVVTGEPVDVQVGAWLQGVTTVIVGGVLGWLVGVGRRAPRRRLDDDDGE